jgi:hypothetical protein
MLYVWNDENSYRFLENILNDRLKEHSPILSKFEIRDNKFPMIYVEFFNINDLNFCINILNHPIKTEEWGYMICRILKL